MVLAKIALTTAVVNTGRPSSGDIDSASPTGAGLVLPSGLGPARRLPALATRCRRLYVMRPAMTITTAIAATTPMMTLPPPSLLEPAPSEAAPDSEPPAIVGANDAIGIGDDLAVGGAVGKFESETLGPVEGAVVGSTVGAVVGSAVGSGLGAVVGAVLDGASVGFEVGSVGPEVGSGVVGPGVGVGVGSEEMGAPDGVDVGATEGAVAGAAVDEADRVGAAAGMPAVGGGGLTVVNIWCSWKIWSTGKLALFGSTPASCDSSTPNHRPTAFQAASQGVVGMNLPRPTASLASSESRSGKRPRIWPPRTLPPNTP